jgi:hypothetical protein
MSLAILAGLSLFAMWLLFDYFAARRARLEVTPSPVFEARQLPPEPRLEVSPQQDLRQMRAAEMALLHSYGWVDRQAGIVRIPIERAIDILAARGLQNDGASTIERQGVEPETEGRGSKTSSRGPR